MTKQIDRQWSEAHFWPTYMDPHETLDVIAYTCDLIWGMVQAGGIVSIDSETQAALADRGKKDALDLRKATIVGWSMTVKGAAWMREMGALKGPQPQSHEYLSIYFPMRHALVPELPQCCWDLLRKILTSPYLKIFHHRVFDSPMIKWREGIPTALPALDTSLMSWCWDENMKKSLKGLMEVLIGWRPLEFGNIALVPFGSLPPEVAFRYACQDSYGAYVLAEVFRGLLHPGGLTLLNSLEQPIQELFLDMHYRGWPIDLPLVREYRVACTEVAGLLREELKQYIGDVNPGSPTALKKCFQERLGINVPNVQHGTLMDVEHPAARLIELLRKWEKLDKTYLKGLESWVWDDGRIHPKFIQWYFDRVGASGGAVTGRSSAQDPAVQTYPKDPLKIPECVLARCSESTRALGEVNIRKCWVAPEGESFLKVDSSQLEMRAQAGMTGEPLLMTAYQKKYNVYKVVGVEAHRIMGDPVDDIQKGTVEYDTFKQIVLAQGYGAGAPKVLKILHDTGVRTNLQQVETLYNVVVQLLPMICQQFPAQIKQVLSMQGFLETPYGRRRHFPKYSTRDKKMNNQARNFLGGQSPGFDLMKTAMLGLKARMQAEGVSGYMCGQIHDEVMVLCPDAEVPRLAKMMYEELTRPELMSKFPYQVPLDAEVFVGKNYGELQSYDPHAAPQVQTVPPELISSRVEVLRQVATDIAGCQACDFFQGYGWQKVGPQGPLASHDVSLAWVTSNPGAEELERGMPLVGKAGMMLRQEAYIAGLPTPPVGEAVILNALSCYSLHSDGILNGHINHCRRHLARLLKLSGANLIIALGSVAARAVLRRMEVSLEGMLGLHKLPSGVQVVVSYHPAFLLRSPGYVQDFRGHMMMARKVLDDLK